MEKVLIATLVASAAGVVSNANADSYSRDSFYVGGGQYAVRQDWDDTDWYPIEVFGGYKHNPYVGAEIRVGGFTSTGNPKLKNYESIYYRTESANAVGKTYLLLGYSRAELSAYGGKYTFDGFSYGAGLGFAVSDNFNLNFEYKVLADGKGTLKQNNGSKVKGLDMKLSSFGVTLDYRFGGSKPALSNTTSSRTSSSRSDSGSSPSSRSDSGSSTRTDSSSNTNTDSSSDSGSSSRYGYGDASGVYIFGDLSYTQMRFSSDDEDEPSISENANGFSFGGGYKINKFFAVEVAYQDLGSIDESDEDFSESLGFSALSLSGVASIPLGDAFSLYGRLGISKITMDIDVSDEGESESISLSKNKALYGVGGRFAINDQIGLRLEVNQFADWENISLTSLRLGVDYRF